MLVGREGGHPDLLQELDEDELALEVHLLVAEDLPDEASPAVIAQHEVPDPVIGLALLVLGLDGPEQLPRGLEVALILEYVVIDDLPLLLTMLLVQKLIQIIFIDGLEVDIQRGRLLLVPFLHRDVQLPRLVAVVYSVEFALA